MKFKIECSECKKTFNSCGFLDSRTYIKKRVCNHCAKKLYDEIIKIDNDESADFDESIYQTYYKCCEMQAIFPQIMLVTGVALYTRNNIVLLIICSLALITYNCLYIWYRNKN